MQAQVLCSEAGAQQEPRAETSVLATLLEAGQQKPGLTLTTGLSSAATLHVAAAPVTSLGCPATVLPQPNVLHTQRVLPDGKQCVPTKESLTCSKHSVENEKSPDPHTVSHNPTIKLPNQVDEKKAAPRPRWRPIMPKSTEPDGSTLNRQTADAAASGASKTVTFRWKEHRDFLANGLMDFMQKECQADANVTYGEEQMKVHRLVLSIFLPSVKRTLDTVEIPVAMTKLDLSKLAKRSDDVRNLIEFLYTGRATVIKDQVESLRRLAEALHFEGLVHTIDEDRMQAATAAAALDCSLNPIDMCDAVMLKEDSESENEHEEMASPPLIKDDPRSSTPVDLKKLKCNLCNKVFRDGSSLSRHIDTNHKVQPKHRCLQCSKSYTRGYTLQVHTQKVHGNKCSKCGRHYKDGDILRKHVSAVHVGSVPPKCRRCYVKAVRADDLERETPLPK